MIQKPHTTNSAFEQLTNIVIVLLTLAAVVLAVYPDLVSDATYKARLWHARRDRTNYARLRFMRDTVQAGGYADDVAPAPRSPTENTEKHT